VQQQLAAATSALSRAVKTRQICFVSNPEFVMLQTRMQVCKRNVAGFKPATSSGKAVALHKVHTKALAKATAELEAAVKQAVKAEDTARSRTAVWSVRAALTTNLALANSITAAAQARVHFSFQPRGPRLQADIDSAINFVFKALENMRVCTNTIGVVSVQGAGKSGLIRVLQSFDKIKVLLENHLAFMPDLTKFLCAVKDSASTTVIQQLCFAAENSILAARHDVSDYNTNFVVERLPACCLLFSFVAFKDGFLSKTHFFDIVRRVVAEGFLPGQIWFLAEEPTTCKQRLQARADAETDPVLKAQHQAEADSPLSYLTDLFKAHELFYSRNPRLAGRVQVLAEKLPTRSDAAEYSATLRRVYGGRMTDFFGSAGRNTAPRTVKLAAAAASQADKAAAP
jgi:hypothetical protein